MKLYTTKKSKDTHHIFTVHPPIFNELIKLNPNIYFCIYQLMQSIATQNNIKLVLNHEQNVSLHSHVHELNASAQALVHLNDHNDDNQKVLFHCYNMFMEKANLAILQNTPSKALTPKYVANVVNILNQTYDKLCSLNIEPTVDNNTTDSFITLIKSKKGNQIQFTEKALSLLYDLSPQEISLFNYFPKKFFCYATVEWSDISQRFINHHSNSFNIDNLDSVYQWKYHICKDILSATTPLLWDQEFISWITLIHLIFNEK